MGIDEDIQNAEDVVRVKLTFSKCLIREPIIYEMAHLYNVVFNIIKANVEKDHGWVIMDVSGVNKDIDNALYWLYEQNVKVDLTLSP